MNESLKANIEQINEAYNKSTNTNEQIMLEFNQLREEKRRIVDKLMIEEQKKINEVKEKMLLELQQT